MIYARRNEAVKVKSESSPEIAQPGLDAYPNPFLTGTTVAYRIDRADYVRIVLYDVAGRVVRTLVESQKAPGMHAVRLDGASLSAGLYFLDLDAGSGHVTRAIVLNR